MAKRLAEKMKEKLGLHNEPIVQIPKEDKVVTMKDVARAGFVAIDELYDDRNHAVKLSQSLHRHNVYLNNVNIALREQLVRAQTERDFYMKMCERIGAWVATAHDNLGRVLTEVGQTKTSIDALPNFLGPTNNPSVPEIDAVGLPLFDHDGMSSDDPLPQPGESIPEPTAAEISALAQRLNGGHS